MTRPYTMGADGATEPGLTTLGLRRQSHLRDRECLLP